MKSNRNILGELRVISKPPQSNLSGSEVLGLSKSIEPLNASKDTILSKETKEDRTQILITESIGVCNNLFFGHILSCQQACCQGGPCIEGYLLFLEEGEQLGLALPCQDVVVALQ